MSFWDKTLKTDLLKGLFMVIPSVLFGSFSFVALSGLNKMITSSIKLSPAAYAKYESLRHSRRKKAIEKAIGDQEANSVDNVFTDRVLGQTKKPAELDSAKPDINEKYKDQQDSEKDNPPLTAILSSINYNPKEIRAKEKLTKTFNEIKLSNWIEELTQDYRFEDKKFELEKIQLNSKTNDFMDRIEEISKKIEATLKDKYPTILRYIDIHGIQVYDPHHVLFGVQSGPNRDPNIDSNLEYRMRFPASLTTEQYLSELQNKYDINIPLRIFLYKDSKMTEMPITSAVNHAKWLKDKGHNIATDRIVILRNDIPSIGKALFEKPPNWISKSEGGTYQSPYLPSVEDMITNLGELFEREKIISTDGDIEGIERYRLPLGELMDSERSDKELFLNLPLELETGEWLDLEISPYRLDVLKISFENAINEKYEGEDNKQKNKQKNIAINRLDEIFDKIYTVYGHTYVNSFTTDLRMTMQRMAHYFNRDYIHSLSEIVGMMNPNQFWHSRFFINKDQPHAIDITAERLIINPIKYILIESGYITQGEDVDINVRNNFIADLYSIIQSGDEARLDTLLQPDYFITRIDDQIDEATQEQIDGVFELVSPYLKKEMTYWIINNKFSEYDNTQKKEFFTRIMYAGNLYGISVSKLGMLIFNDRGGVNKHFYEDLKDADISLTLLERIKFSVINWDHARFNEITGRKVTNIELTDMQNAIIQEINDWILSRGFVDSSLIKIKDITMKKESLGYQALTNIIFAATLKKAKDKGLNSISLDKLKPIIFELDSWEKGLRPLLEGLSQTGDRVKDLQSREKFKAALQKIYATIHGWHEEEFGIRRPKRATQTVYEINSDNIGLSYDRTNPLEHQRMYYYQEAMNSIYEFVKSQYAVKKGVKNYFLDFPSPTIKSMNLILSYQNTGTSNEPTELIANGYDRKYWDNKITKAFHRTTLLSKYRGFDPFFRALTNDDTVVRHHFRIFTFRKMSSNVRDIAPMTLANMISDFEPLIDELGPKKAEAFVDALMGALEELDSLKDKGGKIRKITEVDIIAALKHHFGTEWRDAYDRILDKNDGALTDFIKEFNDRGEFIENKGYKEFMKLVFKKYHDKDLPLLQNVQLSNILCAMGDDAYLNALFAGYIYIKRIKLQANLGSF